MEATLLDHKTTTPRAKIKQSPRDLRSRFYRGACPKSRDTCEFYVVHDPGDVGVLAGETPHHPLQITVADQLDEIFINQTFVFWQHRVLSRFFSIYLF
jgi:hypothetical protein